MDNAKYAIQVSVVTIIINILLSLIKFIAGILGASSALISDAFHSLSDVLGTIVVIIGVKIASAKSDKEHPYGHERFEPIAAMLLAGFLLGTGVIIAYVAIINIYNGTYKIASIPTDLALYAAVISILLKEGMYWYTRNAAKKIKSDILMADAWHHRSDSLSSFGSLVGIFGAQMGYPILDPLAALFISLFIFKVSYDIFISTIDKITDRACDEETILAIRNNINEDKDIIRLDLLKTRLFGDKIYVDVEISVSPFLSLIDAHAIAERVHDKLEEDFPDIKHCMVHVNPAMI